MCDKNCDRGTDGAPAGRIRGMIFDLDGTLLDSMFIWENVGEVYLRSLGKEQQGDLQKILKPMSLQQSANYLKEQYDLPLSVEEIIDGINGIIEDFYLHRAEPKPGVVQWLEALSERNIKMCVATATDRYLVEAALTRCGMQQYFSEIFTCTEVGYGKDQPIIYRKAMEHLGTIRSNTVVVEDSLHALYTAKEDGFLTVAVYDSYETAQDQMRDMAGVYLADYRDMELFWRFAAEDGFDGGKQSETENDGQGLFE